MSSDSFGGRLVIKGEIAILTGLHIGTTGVAGIGLVDNPIVKDPVTGRPIIPGSSLKGRLRHAAADLLEDDSHSEILRLFGSAAENTDGGRTRLYVRDCHLVRSSVEKLQAMETAVPFAEIKTENKIVRATGVAEHPRQSERLPAGASLEMELVYNVFNPAEIADDLQNLEATLSFVEDEYLGGSGSRGYGKVQFYITELLWKSPDDYLENRSAKSFRVSRVDWFKKAPEISGLSRGAK